VSPLPCFGDRGPSPASCRFSSASASGNTATSYSINNLLCCLLLASSSYSSLQVTDTDQLLASCIQNTPLSGCHRSMFSSSPRTQQ
jgi:hypothetical protein